MQLVLAACITGCGATADTPARRAATIIMEPVALRLAAPRDTAATLQEMERFIAAVDRDTTRMEVMTRPVDIGADARGTARAWRIGRSWQRVQLDAGGAGFHTTDTWWLHEGAGVAARLESVRPNERPEVDHIRFRDSTLYRWTDASGRILNRDARSTRYQVDALRARLTRVLQQLDASSSARDE